MSNTIKNVSAALMADASEQPKPRDLSKPLSDDDVQQLVKAVMDSGMVERIIAERVLFCRDRRFSGLDITLDELRKVKKQLSYRIGEKLH